MISFKKKIVLCIPLLFIVFFILESCNFSDKHAEVSIMPVASNENEYKDGPDEHGSLKVEQGVIKDKNGDTIQLRGMSTHGIGWYPNYVNAGAMKSVRDYGGNVMRIAMYTEADSG